MLVLVSANYKESTNCRRECILAANMKKPILFLMTEEGYDPEGWLLLTMEDALWIDCTTVSKLERNFSQILTRISESTGPNFINPVQHKTSTTIAHGNVGGILKGMRTNYEKIKKTASSGGDGDLSGKNNAELVKMVKELKADVSELKSKMDQLLGLLNNTKT